MLKNVLIRFNIGKEFRLDKCAKMTFKRGKITKSDNVTLTNDIAIKELDEEQTYEYLGVKKAEVIQHACMKEKNRKEYIAMN